MTATPMRLEDALRFNGYTIDQYDAPADDIVTSAGTIHVAAARRSKLTWRLAGNPTSAQSFYLDGVPLFDIAYQPVLLGHILDRYSTRRIGYDTPDQFGLAVRRWFNLHFGPMSVLNRLYVSTAVNLPLTTQDATIAGVATDKARDAASDFPQTQLSGDTDYSSTASDRVSSGTSLATYEGRMGVSVMALLAEQRAAFLNVDAQVLDAMEPLFLGVWDRSERDDGSLSMSARYFIGDRW
jgi:hypothetical protein